MKTKNVLTGIFFGFIGATIAIGGLYTALRIYQPTSAPKLPETNQQLRTVPASFSGGTTDFTVSANMAVPAVVHIKTTFQSRNSYYDDFFAPFYEYFNMRPGYNQPLIGTGSGVIVTNDGYIVTNNHVVQDAEEISVTLNDKREYTATVVGKDANTDLAVIKIDEKDLPFLVFGNSDEVAIGEWVLAVGNPFNLTSTVTAGIISAKARNINILGGGTAVESFLQTDAAVNPGNSGGALVNLKGELVGINAAIASNTGAYSGYSFAIPSNLAKKVVQDIMEFGGVQRGYLGASITELDAKTAKEYGLSSYKGVIVSSVNPRGSADKAGLEAGDVILSVDGNEINSGSRLLEIISEKRPGDEMPVEFSRKNVLKKTTLVLQNDEGAAQLAELGSSDVSSLLGATFALPDEGVKKQLRLTHGIQISELGNGPLKNAGIKKGYIVTEIDHKRIIGIKDIEEAVKNSKGAILFEGYYPNGTRAFYAFGL